MMTMDRRFSRESSRESKGSIALQKKIVESHRPNTTKNVPDLTDFMNDMFFGTMEDDKKAYNLTGSHSEDDEESFDDSTRSSSSKFTQEWLDEARRMVASTPSRCESPSRLVGSPRFAAVPGRLSSASILDRRDPLSRSARRHRSVEAFSGEILTKSAKHSRNKSESLVETPAEPSPASQFQKWFSNILKPPSDCNVPVPNRSSPHQSNDRSSPLLDPPALNLPPRQSSYRKSRFQTETPETTPQGIPVTSRRTFKPAPIFRQDTQLLSPPKNLIESAQRRSISSSTCSKPETPLLSPPKNLMESARRRSISKSTCSIEKVAPKPNINGWKKEEEAEEDFSLNGFLKEEKTKIEKILNRELDSKAKIILSGPSNSTSSMVAAICYALLLSNRLMKNKGKGDGGGTVVFPVMNTRRGRMWKQRQAAWLFQHVGLDATSLLFADEVDLERLMMEGKLSILVVGQDILRTNGEVGSQCTILTDNYCEDAYDLLQTSVLKKLLLAGILLDTQNLNASATCSMTRDAEAVQLLLVGSTPQYRNVLFDQLMQDQKDSSFIEALRHNYGKSPGESGRDNGAQMDQRGKESKPASVPRHEAIPQKSDKNSNNVRDGNPDNTTKAAAPTEANPDASRGKNKFFLAKWFGFGK
ncbi:hypothetical protein SADUNF_Sadunf15G0073800 [Salix dunnii]|uniref:Uncharacterized protein n=1 Tax=Salix dunnii TaxID=1413687 RepID=A0A835MJA3_9ROSI|nr:hypothetical protein SADUNF_Sadunf15G0073800 [Salix dunnii]